MAVKIGGEYYPSQEYYNATQTLKSQGRVATTSAIKDVMASPIQGVPEASSTQVTKTSQITKMGQDLGTIESGLKDLQQKLTSRSIPTPEPLAEVDTTEDITGNQGETFTPPTPLGQSALEDFTASITATLDKQRVALEAAHQAELDRIQTNKDAAEVKRQELLDTQKDILETDVKPLTDPFREETENAERDRLKVEENFFANQALTDELEGLLTDIQLSVQREKDVTGLAAIREPRIASAAEDMTARVGVIQASMAARNNQIAVAENLIDRTVTAMTADRQDQLNYYNSLLSFYDGQKDFEENKIIQLTSDEKGMIETQIGLIEQDMQITLSNVENIKQAMLDPDTAQAYAQAGVTLNDSPEVIAQKLGAYGYTQEVSNTSNQMQTNGYNYLSPGQNAPAGSDVITTTDSKGQTKSWYKKKDIDAPQMIETAGGFKQWNPTTGQWEDSGFSSATGEDGMDERTMKAELELRRQELMAGQADIDPDAIYQQMLNEILTTPDFSSEEKAMAELELNRMFAIDSGTDNIYEKRVSEFDDVIAAEERILSQMETQLETISSAKKVDWEQRESMLAEIKKQKDKITAIKEDRDAKLQTGQSGGFITPGSYQDPRSNSDNPYGLYN